MKAYELLFIVDPAITEENRAALLSRIEGTIKADGGEVEEVNPWGRRKLAYEIDHLTDGDYTLVNFQANPDSIAELDRVLRITDAVKRSIITRRAS